jgi:hypothetical protein
MSLGTTDLQNLMHLLIAEHEKLLAQLEAQQSAMKKLDLPQLDEIARQQDAVRHRIVSLETRRRQIVMHLARGLRIEGQPTLAAIAEKLPGDRARLLQLRERLRGLVAQVSTRATVSGRVANALVGHLNTAVRLLAGAVEQAGLYTRQGTAQSPSRIGNLEALG